MAKCLPFCPTNASLPPIVATKNDPTHISKAAPRVNIASVDSHCSQTGALPKLDTASHNAECQIL